VLDSCEHDEALPQITAGVVELGAIRSRRRCTKQVAGGNL
jgi:hypothetical protein